MKTIKSLSLSALILAALTLSSCNNTKKGTTEAKSDSVEVLDGESQGCAGCTDKEEKGCCGDEVVAEGDSVSQDSCCTGEIKNAEGKE